MLFYSPLDNFGNVLPRGVPISEVVKPCGFSSFCDKRSGLMEEGKAWVPLAGGESYSQLFRLGVEHPRQCLFFRPNLDVHRETELNEAVKE